MINGKKIIALCSSRIFDHQQFSILEEINEYLRPYNCCLLIFALTSDLYWMTESDSAESYVFDIIPYDKLECLIIMDEKIKCSAVTEDLIRKAHEHTVPVVVVDGKYEGASEVSFDYEKGFENVVRHVIEYHGAKKPHFIAGSKGNKFSDARIDIFKKVIAENGIPFDESMISYGEFWSEPARIATQKLIDSGDLPDSVICANDVMAVNVCDVFTKAGIKVPEQVIVTGFDGIEEALLSTPQLSTAGCDTMALAEAVVKCAVGLMNGEDISSMFVLPKLSPNASCGCEYVQPAGNEKMNSFNNKFYRYQDDIRVLYDISTRMQMSSSPEQAASYLNHAFLHDTCCVVDKSCFDSVRNYFTSNDKVSNLCVFFDSEHPDECNVPLKAGELVPNIEKRMSSGYPIVFNALDFMSKPFGYICYSYAPFEINEYTRSASITNTVGMGIGVYVNMHYQKFLTDKITAELKVAAQMQQSMLPSEFSTHSLYEISASMIPAKNVGGDFYDFFQTDNEHLALVMADVSGKGVPAALFMATSKLVLHDRALLPGTPAEILRDVNKHICENNKMGLFITIWFGILDLKTGIVTYANAGHEYPAVKRRDGKYELVESDNFPPVGTDDDMIYEDLTIDMSGGGNLFIYTDGVTDLKNASGEHFGTERTIALLNKSVGCSPEDHIKCVKSGLGAFAGDTEQFDDTTMMCVYFKGI